MQEFIIRQGDQYNLPFPILLNQYIVTDDFIDNNDETNRGDIEITIGDGLLRKTFGNNEVKFNSITQTFDFPLTQEETFELYPGMRLRSQVRIKFRKFGNENNFIYSYDGPDVIVVESISKERI